MTQSKEQLLNQIERTYAELNEVMDRLSPSQFERQPDDKSWSARDILAHIAQWEMVLLRFHLHGDDFAETVGMEAVRYRQTPFEVINEHLYREQRRQTASQIQQFARDTHGQLMAALKTLPAEALIEPAAQLAAQGYSARPLIHYIKAITTEHYNEHLDSLRQLTQLD